MGTLRYLVAFMLLALFVTGCASTTTRFEWGNYENALYQYYKAPSELDSYRQALREAIEDGETEGRLAPGLYAELGYTYMEQGDVTTARELFESEIQNFPESRPFLGGLIQRISPQSAESGTPIS